MSNSIMNGANKILKFLPKINIESHMLHLNNSVTQFMLFVRFIKENFLQREDLGRIVYLSQCTILPFLTSPCHEWPRESDFHKICRIRLHILLVLHHVKKPTTFYQGLPAFVFHKP